MKIPIWFEYSLKDVYLSSHDEENLKRSQDGVKSTYETFEKHPELFTSLSAGVNGVLMSDGMLIRFIDNPTEEQQMIAVNQNGLAIKYINNPSENVKLSSVKNYGPAILFISNPSIEIQIIAKDWFDRQPEGTQV